MIRRCVFNVQNKRITLHLIFFQPAHLFQQDFSESYQIETTGLM